MDGDPRVGVERPHLAVAGVDKAVEVQLLGGCVGKAGRCEVKVFDGGTG